MSCEKKADGTNCPEIADDSCNPYSLTNIGKKDNCFIDSVINESLNKGGADLNVFKLLGVHEQGSLIDLTKNGTAISGGSLPGFAPINAFEIYATEWHSIQKGDDVTSSAYIGYDFGILKLANERAAYGVETSIRHNLATLKIKQGAASKNRATKIRIERSDDGNTWYGVAIVTLPDDDALNTIYFKHSVPSRYWRLRPVEFNGGVSDYWIVQAIEFMDYDQTSIDDIQDQIFLENRDRDYASESVTLKGTYDLIDIQTELTRFGIELPSQSYYIHVNFNQAVLLLGRPFVIGDIIEMPSEVQYSPSLEPIKKYLEVMDVGWSTEGYTPGWLPTMQRIVAVPMIASQETQDIFGGLAADKDLTGLLEMNDGNHPVFQDFSNAEQTIAADAKTDLPERGRDGIEVEEFTPEQIQSGADQGVDLTKIGLQPKQLYVEDGLPPNDEPFSTGDQFPQSPSDGDYHRLTYSNLAENIPARLFRYSLVKGRWIYMETDRRQQYNAVKPVLQEFLSSPTSTPTSKIDG